MIFLEKLLDFDLNRNREFPGQQPGEEVELITVFHWVSLLPFFLQLSVVALFFGIIYVSDFYAALSEKGQMYTLTLAIALLLHLTCFRLYNYFLKVLVITNFRVIEVRHTVFLKREREAIPMLNVQDFRYQQNGIWPRLLNYGTLIILGASTDVKYVIHHLPQVGKIHHLLSEVHQKAMRTRNAPGVIPEERLILQEG